MKLKKTKKQKGGSSTVVNASKVISQTQPEIDYDRAITYLDTNSLTHIKELFITTFGKNKKISFNSYLRDTFIQGNLLNQDSDFYYRWYKKINPDFKIILELTSKDESGNETDFRLPEFKIFVANLAKDLLMMILYRKFNDSNETHNNKQKYLKGIHNQIENSENYDIRNAIRTYRIKNNNITPKKNGYNEYNEYNGYNANNENNENNRKKTLSVKNSNYTKYHKNQLYRYKSKVIKTNINKESVIEKLKILLKKTNKIIGFNYIYIQVQDLYIEFIKLVSIKKSSCLKYIDEIKKIYEFTPYIVYPSYWTLDFKEVVNLCSTPILNFKFMNRRRLVHYGFHDPCDQIDHDIIFHGKISHSFHNYFAIYKNKNNNNKKKEYSEMRKYFEKYFETMNSILTNLNEFYNYNEKLIKDTYGKHEILNNKDKINYESLDDNLKHLCFGIVLFYVLHENDELTNNIESFSQTNKIIQFVDSEFQDINASEDPNSPTTKYPILKTINWGSVYQAFKKIITELNIIDEEKPYNYSYPPTNNNSNNFNLSANTPNNSI
jgi:hypothetical protein